MPWIFRKTIEKKRNILIQNVYETLSVIKCLDHKNENQAIFTIKHGIFYEIIITPQSKIDNHTVFIITGVLNHKYSV